MSAKIVWAAQTLLSWNLMEPHASFKQASGIANF